MPGKPSAIPGVLFALIVGGSFVFASLIGC